MLNLLLDIQCCNFFIYLALLRRPSASWGQGPFLIHLFFKQQAKCQAHRYYLSICWIEDNTIIRPKIFLLKLLENIITVSYKNSTRKKNCKYDSLQGPQVKILFINTILFYKFHIFIYILSTSRYSYHEYVRESCQRYL